MLSWRHRFSAWLWGYDYFVSYHWASGGVYAVALAESLRDRGYDVFLDRAEYAMGDDWKQIGERALRQTRRLVLVATREALTVSKPVEHEVMVFTARGQQVIPIIFYERSSDGRQSTLAGLDPTTHPVLGLLPDSKLHIDDDLGALSSAPSSDVVERLTHTYRVMRRRDIRAIVLGVLAVILVGFAAFAAASWGNAILERNAAESAAVHEKKARADAVSQRNEATRRGNESESRRLATVASTELSEGRWETAILLSVIACRTAPTVDAKSSFLSSLQSSATFESILRTDNDSITALATVRTNEAVPRQLISAGTLTGGLHLWAAGDPINSASFSRGAFKFHKAAVNTVAFNQAGTIMASAGVGADQQLLLWSVPRAAERPKMLGHYPGFGWVAAFSPDGKHLVTATLDGTLAVLQSTENRYHLVDMMRGHKSLVFAAAFSPDGRLLASGGLDKTVQLWDVAKRKSVGDPLTAHADAVSCLAFSPNGRLLATGGCDRAVIVWDVNAHRPARSPLVSHTQPVSGVAFTPDGQLLVTGGRDGAVILWRLQGRGLLAQQLATLTERVSSIAISPDGRMVATGNWAKTVALFDFAARSQLPESLLGHTEFVDSVAFSPDGHLLASGGHDKTVRLWDVEAWKPASDPLAHVDAVTCLAFSPDGRLLAVGGGGEVVLWDVTNRTAVGKPLREHSGKLTCLAWSPDGTLLVTGSSDKTALVWDVGTHKPIAKPYEGHSQPVTSVTFVGSPNMVATGSYDGTICLWDVRTHQRSGAPLVSNRAGVCCLAVSKDGLLLASGTTDHAITLWSVGERRSIGQPLRAHREWVSSLAFTPDGLHLLSAGNDGGVMIWSVNMEDWFSLARKLVKRNLTVEEWDRFIGPNSPYTPVFPDIAVLK